MLCDVFDVLDLEAPSTTHLHLTTHDCSPIQALERSQSEGQALRAHIQYKLAPIVFEQVAALEMLLGAVEHFRSQLSSKVSARGSPLLLLKVLLLLLLFLSLSCP